MRSRVTLTGNQSREIEYDDHDLSGPLLIFHKAGENVLTVTLANLVCIEPVNASDAGAQSPVMPSPGIRKGRDTRATLIEFVG